MRKKIFAAFAASFFLGAFASSSEALEKVSMEREAFRNARGDVIITQADEPDKRRLEVSLRGLEPNGVYTLWFSEGDKKEAVNKGESFKSDSDGKANFTAILEESVIERWDRLAVAFHPDGNPKNTKSAVVSLSGDLPDNV